VAEGSGCPGIFFVRNHTIRTKDKKYINDTERSAERERASRTYTNFILLPKLVIMCILVVHEEVSEAFAPAVPSVDYMRCKLVRPLRF